MQFREHKNIVPVVLYDNKPERLAMKVSMLGKEFSLIDLQYSSHSVTDEKGCREVYSVFVLAQVPEEKMAKILSGEKPEPTK